MPKYLTGELWTAKADLLAVTTNGVISDGRLVMGSGAAKQAADRFPYLPTYAAQIIPTKYPYRLGGINLYGFLDLGRPALVVGDNPKFSLGLFQSKRHYKEPAEIVTIAYSALLLEAWCQRYPKRKIALNFPGIGLGKMAPALVKTILARLPETVLIYAKGD